MPINKLNRILRQYSSNLENLKGEDFLNLIDTLSADDLLKPVLQVSLNLQYEDTQLSGDIREVRNLLPQVGKDEKPHSFSASIQTNANPRKSLNISASFAQELVTFNLQNVNSTEGKELLSHFSALFPEQNKKTVKKDTKKEENTTVNSVVDKPEFLPGAFRPVPMPSMSDEEVFVIMSFQDEYRDTYNLAIKPTIIKMGYTPIRVDEIQHNSTVTPEIMRRIERAVFVIADLSGERPNVYYEVGYAHRADKEVILMAQKDHAVHFDVASINRIVYQDLTELSFALELRIKSIKEVMSK